MLEKKKDKTQKTLTEPNLELQKTRPEQIENESTQTPEEPSEQNPEELSIDEPVSQESPLDKPVSEKKNVEETKTSTVKKPKEEEKPDENIIPIELAPDCESCGMPMQKASDHGNGDLNNPYCVHCTDEEGKLKSKDVVKTQMIEFYTEARNCSWSEAENVVTEMMKHLPAWNKIEKSEEVINSTQ